MQKKKSKSNSSVAVSSMLNSECFSAFLLHGISVDNLKLHSTVFYHHNPLSYHLLSIRWSFLEFGIRPPFPCINYVGKLVHACSFIDLPSVYIPKTPKFIFLVSELHLSAKQFHMGIPEGSLDFSS